MTTSTKTLCPVCQKAYKVRSNGTFAHHGYRSMFGGHHRQDRCAASGETPENAVVVGLEAMRRQLAQMEADNAAHEARTGRRVFRLDRLMASAKKEIERLEALG